MTVRPSICASGCYMPHLCSGRSGACLMRPKAYYPLFADLNGRRCVVIGGGPIAQRKITTLLRYGADLTLVAPEATRRLASYAGAGKIRWLKRRFKPADLSGAWLAYAATDDPATNKAVYDAAQRQRVFANIVDQTPLCTFIAPSIARRGPLTIAVSTGGSSPSLAKRLRHDLNDRLSAEYVPMLRLLRSLRGMAKRRLPKYGDRKRYFDRLVSGEVFRLVRAGRPSQARRAALEALAAEAKHRNGA